MQAADFVRHVKERGHIESVQAAIDASRATLSTLAERLKGGEPADLAAQLPPEIGQYLRGEYSGSGEQFPPEVFVRRVSEREGVDLQTAADHARAVFRVLNEAVSSGEMEDVWSQLPLEYHQLFGGIGKPII